ncbi:hypothetical protein ACFQT0_31125 [Hymenobacter humi]|uniref:Uncharacterized protein n=1 Tax=Hymenobacter humi TaxID=1411620 RepID=A0ABW2UGG7_9BACT
MAVALNGQDLVKHAATSSDFSRGVTDPRVYQDRHGLWVRVAG